MAAKSSASLRLNVPKANRTHVGKYATRPRRKRARAYRAPLRVAKNNETKTGRFYFLSLSIVLVREIKKVNFLRFAEQCVIYT